MRLILYPTSGAAPPVRPAPATRPWMDATPEGFAYRCLPLNIANAHGWELLCPSTVRARWRGGKEIASVEVEPIEDKGWLPISHFGSGVLTFHVGYLVRTDPGHDLWVAGPAKRNGRRTITSAGSTTPAAPRRTALNCACRTSRTRPKSKAAYRLAPDRKIVRGLSSLHIFPPHCFS